MKKSLLDIPPRGQMLLDTINLWAHWRSYKWKKGTGDWWKSPPKAHPEYKKFYNDRSTGWSVIIDEYKSLKIEGSVPRAVKGNNLDSITEDEFPLLEDYIRSLCKGRCVTVNLSNMTVRRVDLARNKALDFHVSGFIKDVGKVKEYGTLKQSKSEEFFGLTYVRWESMRKGQLPQGGPQRETVLYDKIARMQAQVKEGKIDPGSIPERALEGGWLRSEVRLMQSTSCRREGIRKFEALKDNDKHWALWQKENRRIIKRARELGHYTRCVAEPSKEFFRLVRKCVTGRGKQTHILVKLIAGVTGISRFLDEFGGRRGFYKWLDTQKVKTLNKDTWRKRKDRLRKTIDEITKYRTWYMTKAKPSLIWETYEGWVDAGEIPSFKQRITEVLKAKGWSDKEIADTLKVEDDDE